MRFIGLVLNRLAQASAIIGAVCVVLMMLLISADVALRNLFAWPVPLAATLATKWFMVAVAFLPLGLTELRDRNISVEIVYGRFSRTWRRIVGGAVCLVSFAVICVLTVPLWEEAVERMHAGSFVLENGRHLSVWQTYFFLPVGFAIFGAVMLYRVVVLWTGAQSGMGEVAFHEDQDPDAGSVREGI